MEEVQEERFLPAVYTQKENGRIMEFSVLEMQLFRGMAQKNYTSVSGLLEGYYQERDNALHIRQKAHDIRRLVLSNIERCVKKKDIQQKTLRDTQGMQAWKKKGELITANIYAVSQGMTTFRTVDFYDENMAEIEIALDPTKTPAENAQKYFAKYNKAKRTLAALEIQQKQNDEELEYLESVLNALENAVDDADLSEIRTELAESGFIRRQSQKKGAARPKKAESTDIWMHAKNIPGSHVIIRTNGTGEAPDTTLEEAANLAAYFSKAKNSSMVPIDYTQRKNVKKPSGAKPGMVIYLTNRTIYITPDEGRAERLKAES